MNENGLTYSLLTQNLRKYTGKIFYYFLCMMFILQAGMFISCSEEPNKIVTPPTEPTIKDSAIFDWQYIPFPQYILSDLKTVSGLSFK
jgi:hypothetical protein